ncbi:hypothetical protein Fluta_1032 [Fluviicola taffensis DSM 16823]|uniref:Uncharacterized protein n=2 Tax=Fluviicola TaxID=332102 RepID=F2I983_FLUTR|nr:hypothetical protein Fluta_1032 [Fluviicola taffensis DSM 16823]
MPNFATMIKKTVFIAFLCFLSLKGTSQVRLLLGVVGGRYNYLESQQAILATKFNLGYDYSYDPSSNTPNFSGSTDVYNVTKELRWNQLNRGLVIGLEYEASEKTKHSLYFEGRTNSGTGKRTNTTKNFEETFKLKSKFGGIHYNFTYTPFKRIGFFYDVGFTRYRIKFSANSPQSEVFKRETMGYRLNFLSSSYKPGSKELNIVNGIGIDFTVIQYDKLQISLRPEIGFAINKLSEVDLGVLYTEWIFNLNYIQCGLIIKPKISK